MDDRREAFIMKKYQTTTHYVLSICLGFALCACSDIAPQDHSDIASQEQISQKQIMDTVEFQTRDQVEIKAIISIPETGQGNYPAVIFIHQGGSDKSEWTSTQLYKDVVSRGMVAMAYDVRGHGSSGGKGGRALFDDPNRAPLDLQAALKYLSTLETVDLNRIAVVGSSIGANLACVAVGSSDYTVKTAVAISGKTSAVFNLAGGPEKVSKLSSVFLIASELEQGGKRAEWATELHDLAATPKHLEIIKGSKAHGVHMFKDDTALQTRILNWLEETL